MNDKINNEMESNQPTAEVQPLPENSEEQVAGGMSLKCPNCGKIAVPGFGFCPHCGKQ